IKTGNPLQRPLVELQLEFLAELVVLVDRRNVDIDCRQRVEVDRGLCAVPAICSNRLEPEPVGQANFALKRDAPGTNFLLGVVKRPLAVEHVVEHWSPAQQAGDQAMTATRVAVVPCLVARESEEDVVRGLELDRAASRPDVLVVILGSGGEIFPEAAAGEPPDGSTQAQSAGKGG